jgi:hypothetical protein
MILIDVEVQLEHVQVIRSNIGPKSVEKCRDVQNEPIEPISGKKLRDISLGQFVKTPLYFFETEKRIFQAY